MRQEATVRLHTSQIMNANHRMHWRTVMRKKSDLVQFGQLALGRELKPTLGRQQVTFQFTFPTKRRRDRANLHPTCKHLLDGIVRAKTALIDDSDDYIDGPDIVITEETSAVPGFVLVTVVLEDLRTARRRRLNEAEAQIMRERDQAVRAKEIRDAEKKAARRKG